MVYYLAGQKYRLTLLYEMMIVKREADFGHAMVILFSNSLKKLKQKKVNPCIRIPNLSTWQKRMMPAKQKQLC
jgi:hypothetical protein